MEAMRNVIWAPQPAQAKFITCPVFEILYGGARGGGKTDALLGEWMAHAQRYGSAAIGLLVRRELPQLDELIARARELFEPLGAVYREGKKLFLMPGGARLRLRYLAALRDAASYQGHQYTRLYVEEATSWPDSAPIDRLRATLRSARGVPVGLRLTANPGGPGHSWVKERYIDPAPAGFRVIRDENGLSRVFIPAFLRENAALQRGDPGYADRLRQSGSAALVRAWLEGDWSAVDGAYFDCWQAALHVLRPVALPDGWARFRSFDWGSARPFSVGWWGIVDDAWRHPDGALIPRGSLLRYREWYGQQVGARPNTGMKMTADAVADGIKARETGEPITSAVADPSIFSSDGGPSIAERMGRRGVHFRPADNRRVGARGAMGGWDQLRSRLLGQEGRPLIYCFSNCADSIRTIPSLAHDPIRPEDVDTSAEDHAADEWRYACMSRPLDPGRRAAIRALPSHTVFDRGDRSAPSSEVTDGSY